jgi:hypothetical protein
VDGKFLELRHDGVPRRSSSGIATWIQSSLPPLR